MFASNDKSDFLIGTATHGHHQIEMACETCHTDAFGGQDALQAACLNCHAQELEDAHDSHPKKKFTDPRNADLLEIIDARYCISCHTEHQEEQTHAMGVTIPEDYCYHCHQETLEQRESHKGLAFDTCASAGCHNFHDNRALYENFLVANANQPWLNQTRISPARNAAQLTAKKNSAGNHHDFSEYISKHQDIKQDWLASRHAEAGINCGGCHSANNSDQWLAKPGVSECRNCHANETEGFMAGKHGMRLSDKLSQRLNPITPAESRLSFKESSLHTQQGCNSCHSAHRFDTASAATEGCLSCHNDEHSLAFMDSPHGQLWQLEQAGEAEAGSGVSCASCHMPRIEEKQNGLNIVRVEHNQNMNLRPNEKMIRPVCMQCHSLEFSIDALADNDLIRNNFNGKPAVHIESMDWALKRNRNHSN